MALTALILSAIAFAFAIVALAGSAYVYLFLRDHVHEYDEYVVSRNEVADTNTCSLPEKPVLNGHNK